MTQPAWGKGRRILAVLALTNLISYAARNALFAVYPDLKIHFGISDTKIGFLQTVFMVPHAAATLPFGWAGDRFDRRRVIVAGVVLASVAGAACAIGASYWWLAVARGLVGLGTAAIVPVANSILGQVFEGPTKTSRFAIFNLGLFLGGVVGIYTGIKLGFPLVVIAIAVPGAVLAALIAAMPIPPHPAEASRDPSPSSSLQDMARMARNFRSEARAIMRIRTLRWMTASTTLMAFAAGGYGAWLKEFLVRDKGMSDKAAGNLVGLALLGGLSGILVGGRIADWMRARFSAGRLWTIVLGMSCTAPCAAIAIELPDGPALYAAGVATLFFVSWYHAPMAATVDDLAPHGLSVAAQGLVIFTMHMLGTSPASWVVGAVSQHWNLHIAMWVPTVAIVLAALLMVVATPSFAKDLARSGQQRSTL
jgi:MFS family permease